MIGLICTNAFSCFFPSGYLTLPSLKNKTNKKLPGTQVHARRNNSIHGRHWWLKRCILPELFMEELSMQKKRRYSLQTIGLCFINEPRRHVLKFCPVSGELHASQLDSCLFLGWPVSSTGWCAGQALRGDDLQSQTTASGFPYAPCSSTDSFCFTWKAKLRDYKNTMYDRKLLQSKVRNWWNKWI